MIITLLPAIALPHPKKRSPFTSQKRSHFPHPKTAIASPTPQKRSHPISPKSDRTSYIPNCELLAAALALSHLPHPQTAIAIPNFHNQTNHNKQNEVINVGLRYCFTEPNNIGDDTVFFC
ncbi:MAG: hypothetical protein ACKPEQ_11745 [Dolichospermum sp.]